MFTPWNVYRIFVSDISPPKEKICVCFDGREEPSFFMINSEPRFHNIGQIPISGDDLNLLDHDSYIDLSKVPHIEQDHLDAAIDYEEVLPAAAKSQIEQAVRLGVSLLSGRNHRKVIENLK